MNQPQLLDYRKPEIAGPPPRSWIVPLVLGVAQIPWGAYWFGQFMDTHSLEPVRLVQDSLWYILELALTFPAIASSAVYLYQARWTRQKRVIITCSIVLGLSLLLLVSQVRDWYSEVYLWQGRNYGLW